MLDLYFGGANILTVQRECEYGKHISAHGEESMMCANH